MICPNCRYQLADGMLFCPDCGYRIPDQQLPDVNAVPEPAKEPEKAQVQEPTQSWEPVTAPAQPEPQSWESMQTQPQPQPQPAWEPIQPQPQSAWEPQPAKPQPKPQPQPPKQKPSKAEAAVAKAKIRHKRPKAGIVVLSIFLCLLLFLSGFYAALLGTIHLTFNESSNKAMMNSYKPAKMTMISLKNGEVVSFNDFLEEACDVDFEEDYGITEKELNKVLDEKYVKTFLADLLTDYSDSILRGEKLRPLSRNRLLSFFEKHDEDIYKKTGYSVLVLEAQYEGYYVTEDTSEVDAIFDSIGTDEITMDWAEEETGINLTLIAFFLSTYALIAAAFLAVCFLALIFLINRKTPYSAFTASGLTLVILGGIFALTGGAGLIFSLISKISLINLVLQPLALRSLLIGVIILAVGLILLIACRKIYDAIARKKLAAAGDPVLQPQ